MTSPLPAPPTTRLTIPGGWTFWWLAVIAIAGGTALMLSSAPGYPGIAAALRFTARTSLALFLLAFTASSLAVVLPGAASRWLRANRRHLGLAFAASHAIHLAIIVTFWDAGVADYIRAQPAIGFVINVIAYLVLAAMAATSFAATRGMLSPRVWSLLHRAGGYVLWFGFAKSYLPRALAMPGYWVPVALLAGALVLRLAARRFKEP